MRLQDEVGHEGGCTCRAVRYRMTSGFTASKQHWVLLDPRVPVAAEYYRTADHWPAASLERRHALQEARQR